MSTGGPLASWAANAPPPATVWIRSADRECSVTAVTVATSSPYRAGGAVLGATVARMPTVTRLPSAVGTNACATSAPPDVSR